MAAAKETVRLAGLDAERIQALFFTGGSTGLAVLTEGLSALFPGAERVHGDRFANQGASRYCTASRHQASSANAGHSV